MRKRILVTGGAGFIGSHLARRLLHENHEVLALDNLSTGDWSRCPFGITRLECDISTLSVEDLSELFAGCDEIYHLAAVKLHNERNTEKDIITNNIESSASVFEACGIAGVRKVFFSSSVYVYGSMGPEAMRENDQCFPTTHYGLSKLWGEHCLKISAEKYGFRYVIGRLFFIYGPNQYAEGGYKSVIRKNVERILENKTFLVTGDGEQKLDYLHVYDCSRILIKVMRDVENLTINISSGVGTSINQIARILFELNGSGVMEFNPPDWTNGSKRIGDNRMLRQLIPDLKLIDVREGIESVLNELK